MVHRERNYKNRPTAFLDKKWDAKKKAVLIEGNAHKADSECYRDTIIHALCQHYKDKCAMCERKRGIELEVDHYRPKKKRSNKISNTKYNHSGYYWLTYIWSNFLPLCSKCNTAKSNKFPLVGWNNQNRIQSHLDSNGLYAPNHFNLRWLQHQEKPLLLHPELETQPINHFVFTNRGGIIGRTDKGKETINICALDRKELKRARNEIVQDYAKSIKKAVSKFLQHKNKDRLQGELEATFERIRNNVHKDAAHSLLHVYIYKRFDYFIGTYLPSTIRTRIVNYFKAFKASYTA